MANRKRAPRRRQSRPSSPELVVEQPLDPAPTQWPDGAPSSSAPAKRRRRGRSGRKPAESWAAEEPSAEQSAWEDDVALEETPPETPIEPTGFTPLGLSPVMLRALAAARYVDPTPVQAGLIPRALADIDVMGQAQTGTGKTAAFAVPILEKLTSGKHRGPQALVLVPTRELAVQVRDECTKLAHGRRIHVVACYGGKPFRDQAQKLARGAEVVVGTPGRVLDHLGRGTLFVGDLRQVVLDEADRMLDIGFRPDIEKILRQCPQSRQTLLLSATLPPPVLRLARRYMREPEELDFSPTDIAVETIEQFYFTVDPEQKFDLLVRLIEREKPTQAIIFCRTRRGTEKIHVRLKNKVESVAAIHGDLEQRVRDRVMESFRAGRLCLLVATDVVGRGIDVTGISHIINFDVPEFCDDYVHRVGRTGRMGREGVAYTFVTPEQGNELTRIEMRINHLLKRGEMPGIDLVAKPVES
ncbi:MAG TPA: DEAD/DEAH box helicase, partial [Thermoguttaceae bacterium]|nr:DEAD/DEAH box helicase [Thermoguttaceae bacterium]